MAHKHNRNADKDWLPEADIFLDKHYTQMDSNHAIKTGVEVTEPDTVPMELEYLFNNP